MTKPIRLRRLFAVLAPMLLGTTAVATASTTLTGCGCAHIGGPSDPVYKASNLRVEGALCIEAKAIDVDQGCSGDNPYTVSLRNACTEELTLRVGAQDQANWARVANDAGTVLGEGIYRTESGESCTPQAAARDVDASAADADASVALDANSDGSALSDASAAEVVDADSSIGLDAAAPASTPAPCRLVAIKLPPRAYASVYSPTPNPSGAERAMFGTLGAATQVSIRWTAQ